MKTSIKILGIGILIIFSAIQVNGQCETCNTTINSDQSGSIEVKSSKTTCITESGSFTGEITLKGNSKLCNYGIIDASNINFNSSATIYNYGTILLDQNVDLTGTLVNEGTIEITGTFVNKGTITNSGTFTNTGSFDNSTSGSATLTNSGVLSIIGNFSNNNDFTNTVDGSLNVTGTFNNTSSGSTTLVSAGAITVEGDFTNSNDFTSTGEVTIHGDFNNTSSGSTTLVNEGILHIKGDFTNSNDVNNTGTFTLDGDFSQSNTGSAEIRNEGEMTFRGDLYSDNDIYNEGIISVGGTYTNKNWSGVYTSYPNSLLVVDSLINEYNINSYSSDYGQIQVLSYSENTGTVSTYLDVCIMANSGTWNVNTGTVSGSVTYCTNNVEPTKVSLNVKVFLESTYNAVEGKMDCVLRSNHSLPKRQPFTRAPWSYSGTESVDDSVSDISVEIVDWIKLELRSTTSAASKFFEKTFFLTNTGTLTDSKGAPATIDMPEESSFYIVISARNHLAIMSSSTVAVSGGAINYNFTTAQSKAYTTGANPMVEVQSGVFALYTGDVNGDGTINAKDAFEWYENSGGTGYSGADLNMDNEIDADDKSLWQTRNGYSIQFSNT